LKVSTSKLVLLRVLHVQVPGAQLVRDEIAEDGHGGEERVDAEEALGEVVDEHDHPLAERGALREQLAALVLEDHGQQEGREHEEGVHGDGAEVWPLPVLAVLLNHEQRRETTQPVQEENGAAALALLALLLLLLRIRVRVLGLALGRVLGCRPLLRGHQRRALLNVGAEFHGRTLAALQVHVRAPMHHTRLGHGHHSVTRSLVKQYSSWLNGARGRRHQGGRSDLEIGKESDVVPRTADRLRF